eukprot:COSAG02_NODE_928_length_15853_cov_9.053574_3_plen_183_part_00
MSALGLRGRWLRAAASLCLPGATPAVAAAAAAAVAVTPRNIPCVRRYKTTQCHPRNRTQHRRPHATPTLTTHASARLSWRICVRSDTWFFVFLAPCSKVFGTKFAVVRYQTSNFGKLFGTKFAGVWYQTFNFGTRGLHNIPWARFVTVGTRCYRTSILCQPSQTDSIDNSVIEKSRFPMALL